MKIKIKKLHPDAIIPEYAKEGDAGLDLVTIDNGIRSECGKYREYKTGLAIEIPKGYVGLIFPRSSISNKNLILTNCVGVIDSGYRGEIKFRFKYIRDYCFRNLHRYRNFVKGDKIGQLIIMPYPQIEFKEVDELSESERGTGGFGSTGK